MASLTASILPARAIPVTFRYKPEGSPQRVSVAGTFNGWETDAAPMRKDAEGGWIATLDLKPGPYQYKFYVDGSRWMSDPKAQAVRPGGNSALWVVPDGESAAHRTGDGEVLRFALSHRPDDVIRLGRDAFEVKMRAAANDVQGMRLLLLEPERHVLPMRRIASDGLTETWSVTVRGAGRVSFMFIPFDGGTTNQNGTFGADGYRPSPFLANQTAKPFSVDLDKMPLLETPAWVRDTVWYQVFPERFSNGDRSNDTKPPKGVPGWDTPLSAVPGNPNSHWWGGDLQGVIDRLPYLKSLGITGIYLNPIFLGPDTHFYATTDYFKVAPELGDEATLKRLVDAAHKDGLRVMLDGVFNHTSVYFFAFRDILENQEKSPYREWYHIRSFPVLDPVTHYTGPDERNIPYDGWWGIKWMPKLNTANPETEKYLLKVATYWIERTGIDGWRLDVANEVAPEFWVKFRKAVKAAKPEACIIGEIWDNAAPWLRGDQFDAVMNYRFRAAALDFFARRTTDAAEFARQLEAVRSDYPPQANAAMFNHLGSHDTTRLLTEAGGDARKVELSTVFQMTYPGAPSVYYGDENGMAGANDPMNRAPMVWEKSRWNGEIHDTVVRAIAMRRAHPALRGLDVETISAPEGGRVAVFLRRGGGETAITAFNASDTEQAVRLPLRGLPGANAWRDAWRGGEVQPADGALTLVLPPQSASVLFPDAPGK